MSVCAVVVRSDYRMASAPGFLFFKNHLDSKCGDRFKCYDNYIDDLGAVQR